MIDPVRHRQMEELNMVELCTRILYNARNELYLNMHFLDVSLSSLGFEADPSGRGLGTDGYVMYYNPGDLVAMYRRGRVHVNRTYLHMVFHCLFCHLDNRKTGLRVTGTLPATSPWNLSSTGFTSPASMCRRRLSGETSICAWRGR